MCHYLPRSGIDHQDTFRRLIELSQQSPFAIPDRRSAAALEIVTVADTIRHQHRHRITAGDIGQRSSRAFHPCLCFGYAYQVDLRPSPVRFFRMRRDRKLITNRQRDPIPPEVSGFFAANKKGFLITVKIAFGVGLPRLPRLEDDLRDPDAGPTRGRGAYADRHGIAFAKRLENIQPDVVDGDRQLCRQFRFISRNGKFGEDNRIRSRCGSQLDKPDMTFDILEDIPLIWPGLNHPDLHAG